MIGLAKRKDRWEQEIKREGKRSIKPKNLGTETGVFSTIERLKGGTSTV